MSMTVTNVDLGSVELWNGVFQDEVFTAASAKTFLEGTILARLTATGKLVVYEIGGTGGAEIPLAVLNHDLVVAAPGDVKIRPMLSGKVIKERLVVDADGDDSNITLAILDQMRDFTIVAQNVPDISILDNQ